MSSPCNVHFNEGDYTVANIYLHCDGDPAAMMDTIDEFFKAVEQQAPNDPRFGDPDYLAAKFVVWQAHQNSKRYDKPMLDFLSLGIVDADAEGYVYTVDCNDRNIKGRPMLWVKAPGDTARWPIPSPSDA